MYGFEFNGINSTVYGVYLKSKDRALLPESRKREIIIPGKHGTYDFGFNKYGNRVITIEINYIGESLNDMRLNSRNIAVWLSQPGYKKLIFDDEPDKYYLAKVYNAVGLESLFESGKASISFECQPHALYVVTSAEDIYLDDGVPLDSDVILDAGDDYMIHLSDEDTATVTVIYNGNFELGLGAENGAKFDIAVTGTFSEFSISVNDRTLTYTENCIAQTITIDNVNATVKNGTTNKLSNLTGDITEFLKLVTGSNLITLTKTGENIDFIFDFRSQFV